MNSYIFLRYLVFDFPTSGFSVHYMLASYIWLLVATVQSIAASLRKEREEAMSRQNSLVDGSTSDTPSSPEGTPVRSLSVARDEVFVTVPLSGMASK